MDAVAEAGAVAWARQPDLLRHGVLLAHLQRHRRHPRLPRGLDREAALARLRLRRLQQRRLRHRRPRPQVGNGYTLPDDLWFANWNGQANTTDPYVPTSGWTQHQRIHQYRGGHDETYGGVTINIDNNYVDGATVGTAAPVAGQRPGRLDRPGRLAGAGAGAGEGLGLRLQRPDRTAGDPRLRRRPAGGAGRLEYDLGRSPASRASTSAPSTAGRLNHGFDLSFPTTKSGPQPICLYALNTGGGADRLLGWKSTTVPWR